MAFRHWVSSMILAGLSGGVSALPMYEIYSLGDPALGTDTAYGVNDAGVAVGDYGAGGSFLWESGSGVVVDILPPPTGAFPSARAINNSNQVTGYYWGGSSYRAFMWDPLLGSVDLGTLGGNESRAYGISDAGYVAGSSTTGTGQGHAFVWDSSFGMQDLGTLGGSRSTAMDVNDSKQAAGYSTTASGANEAFLWDPSLGLLALGTLGGDNSFAFALNDLAQVVGYAQTSGNELHAFLWDPAAGMIDLGTLGGAVSRADDINDSGQVVGWSFDSSRSMEAFLWDEDLGMLKLEDLVVDLTGWDALLAATGISNTGFISGWGIQAGGTQPQAFVLAPIVGVAEPGIVLLFLAGFAGLVWSQRRQISTLPARR